MTSVNSLKVFFSSVKYLQNLHKSFLFSNYEALYRKTFKKMFRLSSVSFSFRIVLKPEIRDKLDSKEKEKLREEILTFVNDKSNYIKGNGSPEPTLNIDSVERFLKSFTEKNKVNLNKNIDNLNDLFTIELLLVKRASSTRDRYSGNIAFPGGKFEKEDVNDFNTAVRETKEEIGLTLCQDNPLISRYIGYNTSFDITLDFRYIVSSHLFVIFDLFGECEDHIVLSTNELSDAIFVPLDYLLSINLEDFETISFKSATEETDLGKSTKSSTQDNKFVRFVNQKVKGHNVLMRKLMLNHNDNFLIYGLTLRKIRNLLNIEGTENFKYYDDAEFQGKGKKTKKVIFKVFLNLINFFTNPHISYKLLRNVITVIIVYYFVVYIYNSNYIRSKF